MKVLLILIASFNVSAASNTIQEQQKCKQIQNGDGTYTTSCEDNNGKVNSLSRSFPKLANNTSLEMLIEASDKYHAGAITKDEYIAIALACSNTLEAEKKAQVAAKAPAFPDIKVAGVSPIAAAFTQVVGSTLAAAPRLAPAPAPEAPAKVCKWVPKCDDRVDTQVRSRHESSLNTGATITFYGLQARQNATGCFYDVKNVCGYFSDGNGGHNYVCKDYNDQSENYSLVQECH